MVLDFELHQLIKSRTGFYETFSDIVTYKIMAQSNQKKEGMQNNTIFYIL